ncbi:MAG TPA: Flp family type IVb pilin [Actinomycetota bacterium]|nr:Flp family type IVb pilin [Actinomycetota bacterium]
MGGPALGPTGSEDGKVHEVMELFARVVQRLSSEDGATAIEYALMVALIAMVIIASVMFLGQTTDQTFLNVGSAVSAS